MMNILEKLKEVAESFDLKDQIEKHLTKDNFDIFQLYRDVDEIYKSEDFCIGAKVLPITESQNCFYSIDYEQAFFLLSDADLTLYTYDENDGNTIQLPVQHFKKGDYIYLNKSMKGCSIINRAPCIVLEAKCLRKNLLSFTYDLEGKIINCSSTDNQLSKLQFAARLLGNFPGERQKSVLLSLIKCKAHFVRWQAMQSFALIASKQEIKEQLLYLLNDESADIKAAVKKVLRVNFGESV